jgi:hypothetical protein
MDSYAFLFDIEHPDYDGLADFIFTSFYRALLVEEGSRLEAFQLRAGLLLPDMAYRLAEVRTERKSDLSGNSSSDEGFSYQADTALWLALLADLADSAKETWCTFEPATLPYYLAHRPTWIMSASALKRSSAERIDGVLQQADQGYRGALQVDIGNPLQIALLWDSQVAANVYDGGHLGLHGEPFGEEEFSLDTEDQWWSSLQFDSIFWLRGFGYEPSIGEERVISAPIDRSRTPPVGLKRGPLSARGAASRMLYKVSIHGVPGSGIS